MKTIIVCRALLAVAAPCIPVGAANTCQSLSALNLPETALIVSQSVPAGTFTPPKLVDGPGPPLDNLPAFCRVAGSIKPTKDSDIRFETWMPVSRWNGKFMGVGNGGWAGSIPYRAMGAALREGYATASSDTGHEGDAVDASWALGHPEKVSDYGYRAAHEMTAKAKAIIAAYYGDAPRLSYWSGCSSGGHQGLKEAQRFPNDYDGIVAGAPANFFTHLMASGVWIAQATFKDPTSYIPESKYPLIHQAAIAACDELDGLKDGLLEDPTACLFDPKVLQCKDADDPKCLTAAQVEAARKIYDGPKNPRTGERIFPGLNRGSELGWPSFFADPDPPIVASHSKYLVFKNPNWDFKTLNFDSDVALADRSDNGTINATDPDLAEFFRHGGKLLLYHGWSDPAIAPENTVNYYKSVLRSMGGAETVRNSIRLFMAPGMGHCWGGDGPFDFSTTNAIEQWVEKGIAPDRLIAAHFPNGGDSGKPDRTRPLCPYPQVAKYKGSGSIDVTASFTCALP